MTATDTKAAAKDKAAEDEKREQDQGEKHEQLRVDKAAEAERAERRHAYADELRNAGSAGDREKVRRKWRADLGDGEQIGDFVLRLADGELVRAEYASTHHDGRRVLEVHEDPQ